MAVVAMNPSAPANVEAPQRQFTAMELQKEAGRAFDLYNRIFGTNVPIPEIRYEALKEGASSVMTGENEIAMRCTPSKSEIAHETAHVWALAFVSELLGEKGFIPVSYIVSPELKSFLHSKPQISMIGEGFADYLACICAPELREEILNKLPPSPTDEQIQEGILRFADSLPEEQRQELLSVPMSHEDLMRVLSASRFASMVARDLLEIHEKHGPEKALEIFLGIDENTALSENPESWRAYLKSNGIELSA